jgi:hypothetical protein
VAKYEERDNAIMANHVFRELCLLDEEDRRTGNDPQWQNIVTLANQVKAIDDSIDVAYITEHMLLDERRFIERDPRNVNVRLTLLGRQNCSKGIEIPRSDIQKLQERLGGYPRT